MRTYIIKHIVAGGGYEYTERYNTLANVLKFAKALKVVAIFTITGEIVYE